MYQMW